MRIDQRQAAVADEPNLKKLGVFKAYLVLLPVSALTAFYVLIASRATAFTQAELGSMRFGWPFKVVTQDLSRYQPKSFPATMEYNWQRNWSEPIATSYDVLAFVINTLILGIAVTACFFGIVSLITTLKKRKRHGQ